MSDAVDSLAAQAGVSREAMLEALKQEGVPDPPPAFAPAASTAVRLPRQFARDYNPQWVKSGLDAIPLAAGGLGGAMGAAGGTLFGMGVGGVPGAIGGAAVGGAGGEAVRQNLLRIPALSNYVGQDAPGSPQEAAGRIGLSAAEQAASQALGEGIGLGLKPLARNLMEGALRVPAKAARSYRTMRLNARPEIAPEIPADIVDSALQEGIRLGGSPKYPGMAKTEALRSKSAEEAGNMLGFMGKKKVSYRANDADVLGDVWKLKNELGSSSTASDDLDYIDRRVREFQSSRKIPSKRGGPGRWAKLSPDDLNEIKTTAQRKAQTLYERRDAGNLDDKSALALRFEEALASGAQKALEKEYDRVAALAGRPTGDLAAANARTGRMIRLDDAVGNAEMHPRHTSAVEFAANIPALGIPRLLKSRAVASRLALGLNGSAAQQIAAQTPRSADMLLRTLINAGRAQPDTTR